ncbi:enoyl-CoA hydratase-related protein [Calderihabitans maritimus]|uniref:short-chain-enoyl-CoA hydratase n=1 Tax=Calderihabitans maritimus TaxID=1246530 RepID=A0A1Z5HWN4_9FIRM|nr:enoyl-CoA hydratase-related protein [Calderihabitans maritimus]GAW93936.1 enoyl-CoA hydratase/carnithine racemase [Calderihabitans maritimus]
MEWETIEVAREDHVAIVSFNRPEALNALSTQMAKDLINVLGYLEEKKDVWAAVLTGGKSRAFCVGADLKERKNMDTEQMKRQRALFVKAFKTVMNFPKPLIAAVHGYALGGGFEFALGCDFIIADETAVFGLPEVTLAIIPGGGGTQNLPRIIGKHRAKELIFTGRRISAPEAAAWGIVNRVVPEGELEKTYRELMKEITQNGPIALQQAKRAINFGVEVELDTGMAFEAECYNVCLTTEDRNEGLRAFNEKRKPVYKGC